MILSQYTLKNIQSKDVIVPEDAVFDLPEKVLQFGTGVLLRGLPDYFIDKANRQGIFNGRIVVVKSTDGGDASAFDKQDSLYTICVRGVENGEKVEENIVSSSISRVLSAKSDWASVLKCAHNPDMQVIISNTTEVGIQLVNDNILSHPPDSFPGKLLAFLYERYKAFDGSASSGMIIIPTELIVDNGKKLESIVFELAHLNSLEDKFIEWLESSNRFCSSLVDRIVPGKPAEAIRKELEEQLGVADELMIMAESYRLWAIEGDAAVASVLSFAKADEGVVIAEDIGLFRELKLRMLNGTHTLSCGLAFLAGFRTVKEGMNDKDMSDFVSGLMLNDIAPAIPFQIKKEVSQEFGNKVLDRFRNPYIEHQWISITMQYTSKMRMRNIPVLQRYNEVMQTLPEAMVFGFAAYLLFMRVVRKDGNKYFGEYEGVEYPVQDDKASYFYEKWQLKDKVEIVDSVLGDTLLWGTDLKQIPGFAGAVRNSLNTMLEKGVLASLRYFQHKQILV